MDIEVHRWLVIEDHQEPLKRLNDFVPVSKSLLPAGTVEQARNLLLARPFRVVSFDLGLPDAAGLVSSGVGVTLLEKRRLPLARSVVYTGFRNTDDGLSAAYNAGEGGFWVLAKGARNQVEGRVATASPLGWCALMLHLQGQPIPDWGGGLKAEAEQFLRDLDRANPGATEPWQRSWWRQAQRHLPQPLAEAAERYAAAVIPSGSDVQLGREALLALNDLREWLLWLAAAQTAVILRQHGPLSDMVCLGGPNEAHSWLGRQLKRLDALPPHVAGAVAWREHLGCYRRSGPKGSVDVDSVALDELESLRRERNEAVHGLKPRMRLERQLTMLPAVMDLASFWAANPLLTQVRREGGRWRARALCGKEPADRELPDELVLPRAGVHADHDRVYQLVWRFSGDGPADGDPWLRLGQPTPVLLDWWPFLRVVYNQELGRSEPLLLTSQERANARRWHAQSFSGALRKPELTDIEAAGLDRQPA